MIESIVESKKPVHGWKESTEMINRSFKIREISLQAESNFNKLLYVFYRRTMLPFRSQALFSMAQKTTEGMVSVTKPIHVVALYS